MAKYQAQQDAYFANEKASVIFNDIYFETEDKARIELLDKAVKKGLIKRLDVVKKVKEENKPNLKDEYKNAHPEGKEVPVNKKNDEKWIKSKIEEFTS